MFVKNLQVSKVHGVDILLSPTWEGWREGRRGRTYPDFSAFWY